MIVTNYGQVMCAKSQKSPRCDMIFWCTLYLHLSNLYDLLTALITYIIDYSLYPSASKLRWLLRSENCEKCEVRICSYFLTVLCRITKKSSVTGLGCVRTEIFCTYIKACLTIVQKYSRLLIGKLLRTNTVHYFEF